MTQRPLTSNKTSAMTIASKVRQTCQDRRFSRALETCSWNSCYLLKPLEILLLPLETAWNSWNPLETLETLETARRTGIWVKLRMARHGWRHGGQFDQSSKKCTPAGQHLKLLKRSWNSCYLLKRLEILMLALETAWNAWNSWNSICSGMTGKARLPELEGRDVETATLPASLFSNWPSY